jgi:hypothetical protein
MHITVFGRLLVDDARADTRKHQVVEDRSDLCHEPRDLSRRKEDHLLRRQILGRDDVLPGQGVVARDTCHDLFFEQPLGGQIQGTGFASYKPDVQGAVMEPIHLFRAGQRNQLEVQLRSQLLDTANRVGKDRVTRRAGEPDSQVPGVPRRHPFEVGRGFVDLFEDRRRAPVELSTHGRQPHASSRPLEQGVADLAFDALDLCAQGRLRHLEALSRPAEVQLLRDGDHAPQLTYLHPRTAPHCSAHRHNTVRIDIGLGQDAAVVLPP